MKKLQGAVVRLLIFIILLGTCSCQAVPDEFRDV